MQKINILLADDHKVFAEGLRTILNADARLQVLGQAQDGEELLALVKQYPETHLVILDIEMPNMNGVEVVRHLRKDHPKVRILILTYHNEDDFIFHLQRLGVDGYVIKNRSGQDLIGAILDIIDRNNRPFPLVKEWNPGRKPPFPPKIRLTKRECQILEICDRSSKEIATELNIGKTAVDTHLKNLRKKFEVDSTIKLLRKAISLGYVEA